MDSVGVECSTHPNDQDVAEPLPLHVGVGRRHPLEVRGGRNRFRCLGKRSELCEQQRQQDQKPQHQHTALKDIRPCDGANAAQGAIDQHDQRHAEHTVVVGHVAIRTGKALEHPPHGHELCQQIVVQRDDHHDGGQQRESRGAETFLYEIHRCHISAVARQRVQLGREDQIADDDGQHVVDSDEPAEALSVGRAGYTENSVAAVLGGVERQEEHEEAETPASQIKIPEGIFAACVVADPADQQQGT